MNSFTIQLQIWLKSRQPITEQLVVSHLTTLTAVQ